MSGISHFRVLAHFPSLRTAIREAGLTPHPQGLRIPTAELLRDWAAVAKKLGCVPSRSQYLRHGRYSAGVFTLRFGSWTRVAENFCRYATENGWEGDWAGVLTMSGDGKAWALTGPPPARAPVPHEYGGVESVEGGAALERRAQAGVPVPHGPGRAPAPLRPLAVYERMPERSARLPEPVVAMRCVTHLVLEMIVNTLAGAGNWGMEAETPASPERADWAASWPMVSRPLYRDRPVMGVPLAIPGLAYEPANEMGVIFLFGMLADRLRFRVECLQASFPDCEATREIQPGKWQRVRIEFEFESRNFQTHRHPAEACDVIVCWRHNWPECPMEVVELRKAIGSW